MGSAGADLIMGGAANDLIFGDHGLVWATNAPVIDLNDLPMSAFAPNYPFAFQSIFIGPDAGGAGDLIYGDEVVAADSDGDDIILGQQGSDTIYGGAGDDDIIGGHNVSGGYDAGDRLDGQAGNDVIAGDNAIILRRGNSISPRIRVLSGVSIYDGDGIAQVTDAPQANPTGVEARTIIILDHVVGASPNVFGNDYIAGGDDDDVIFGELGDDVIQGDGSIGQVAAPTHVFAFVDSDGRLDVTASVEGAHDGDDYIEGGGGNDVVFGNLGQDDIVGGSSSLYEGLKLATQRPDGNDILFGGAGTPATIAANALGRGAVVGDADGAGHAYDADVILGDNGNILRLIGVNAKVGDGGVAGVGVFKGFLAFNYDNYTDNLPINAQLKIIPRAYQLLDYTPGGSSTDIGGSDIVHGGDSDDIVHGMTGNDVLYGDGYDDNIYGGTGNDKIFGGSGEDGILGDDGMLLTSRNGLIEPLNQLTVANQQTLIETNDPFTGAVVDITGILKKDAILEAVDLGGYDVIYGGLGDDWIHAGAGDDAVSGAEALENANPLLDFYNNVTPLGDLAPISYNTQTRILETFRLFDASGNVAYEATAYDPANPRLEITNFFLNFNSFDQSGVLIEDGKDRIFGDVGNDWLVGGTGQDRLFGGMGDDYLQLDDNLATSGTDDANIPAVTAGAADFAYGGGGLDVLIANSGFDRMYDWSGEFNSFITPFARFGQPTVERRPQPATIEFLLALGREGGADQSLTEPNGELGLVTQKDPEWNDQQGAPRDPQPGNGSDFYDGDGNKEDDSQVLLTAHGSTPTGRLSASPPPPVDGIVVEKAANALVELAPTTLEDADTAPGQSIVVGTNIVWTYLVRNTGQTDLVNVVVQDDAGTAGNPADDFIAVPKLSGGFVIGDTDKDNILDPGETWLFTSAGVVTQTAQPGLHGNIGTVTAHSVQNGGTVSDTDPNYYTGVTTSPPPPVDGIVVEKAANALVELAPTTLEDADTAPGQSIVVGTNIVWTYLVRNTGQTDLVNVVVQDDAGTAGNPADDFIAVPKLSGGFVIGDTDKDNILDPGETWLFTSAGVVTQAALPGLHGNIGTVTAHSVQNGGTVSDTDPNYYTGVTTSPPPPVDGIVVEKAANALVELAPTTLEDADTAPGQSIVVGTNIVWTYLVRNTGQTDLVNVVVQDDAGTAGNPADDFIAVPKLSGGFVIGDTDKDNILDPGETWLFTSAGVVTQAAQPGLHGNIGTVTAHSVQNGGTVSDTDPNYYTGVTTSPPPPVDGIVVEKAANALVELAPTTLEDADTAPGQSIVVGTNIVWTYLVRNTGQTDLVNVVVQDDAGTAGNPADDFIAVPKLSGGFVIGDTDKDNILDPGETWLFTSAGVVTQAALPGLHGNIGTVTAHSVQNGGTVSDTDPNYYTGVTTSPPPPVDGIVVEKAANALVELAPTTLEDADTAPGQSIVVGTNIVWTYLVRNTGQTDLVNVVVQDDAGTAGNPADDFIAVPKLSGGFVIGDTDKDNILDPGETWLFTSAGVVTQAAQPGLHGNIGTVTAHSVQNGGTVSDTDPNYYTGVAPQPAVTLVKTAHIAGDADQRVDSIADDITYTITVTNSGNVDLTGVVVQDTIGENLPQLLGTPTSHPNWVSIEQIGGISGNDKLEVGETWTYTFVYDVTEADIGMLADGSFVFGGTPAQVPSGGANGSLFLSGTDLPATGSGLIDPFVRLQAKDTEQGYNTDARPYDANNNADTTATFDHSIQLADIPVVDVGGVLYREFRLDLNETNSAGKTNLISLDALKIFSSAAGNLTGLNTTAEKVGTTTAFRSGPSNLLYNLDGAGDITVELTDWSTGSGHGDYAVLIPESAFDSVADTQFIYLYSAFGKSNGTNGGFEEWYVNRPASIDNTATVTATSGKTGVVSDSDFVSVSLVQVVETPGAAMPTHALTAATLPAQATASVATLDTTTLAGMLAEAEQRWIASGLVDAAALSRLGAIEVRVADLDGATLGLANEAERAIIIDSSAAGWGWFVDKTPSIDEEVTLWVSSDQRAASPDSPAYGKIDLLTVVEHELGHLLGFEHGSIDVMGETLVAGVRISPAGASGANAVSGEPGAVTRTTTDDLGLGSLPGEAGAADVRGITARPDWSALMALWPATSLGPVVPALVPDVSGKPTTNHDLGTGSLDDESTGNTKLKIDWNRNRSSFVEKIASSSEPRNWHDGFLNHLGKDRLERNPNADLRVRPGVFGG